MFFDGLDVKLQDKAMDLFGYSVQDSYDSGYRRGFEGKHRDVNLFGMPERGTVRAESEHKHAFKKGYSNGRSDRHASMDLEMDFDGLDVDCDDVEE